jgi:hypothetical protein
MRLPGVETESSFSQTSAGKLFFRSHQVTSFQVSSLPLLTLRIPTSTDCLLVSLIHLRSGELPSRFGRALNV